MKHTVLGAGAIGGLLGTALASLGNEVTMIVRPEKLDRYPETLKLQRPADTLTAKSCGHLGTLAAYRRIVDRDEDVSAR